MLISFSKLQQKYNFYPKGVVHVGSHEGQELEEYHKLGIQDVIFIEANPEIYNRLLKKCNGNENILCFNECISDKDGEKVTFNVANNDGQSSSILELGTHKQMHPEVKYNGSFECETVTLDTLLLGLEDKYDFLNADIQGAEGLMLKGATELLNQFNYLYLEINTTEVYKDCMQLPEMKEFLSEYGFELKETFFPGNCTWGDSFWSKC